MWQNPIQLSPRTFTGSLNYSPYCTSSSWRHHVRPPTLSIHSDSPRGRISLPSILSTYICTTRTTYLFSCYTGRFSTTEVRTSCTVPAFHPFRTSVLLNSVVWSAVRLFLVLLILRSAVHYAVYSTEVSLLAIYYFIRYLPTLRSAFFYPTGDIFRLNLYDGEYLPSDDRYYRIFLIYSIFYSVRLSSTVRT
jgi:hypothetical protein